MKDERNVRRSRAAGRRWQPVAILLAAVLMVLSVPLGLKSAHADETEPYEPIDLLKECGLNVELTGDVTMADDIKTANVVIDLYRVADAIPLSGYDTYDWQLNSGFEALTIDKKIDADGWKMLAQQAADIVLGKAPGGASEWEPSPSIEAIKEGEAPESEITGLDAGLYLVIARGDDVKEYATTVTDEAAGTSGTATIANSKTYSYKFAPELVSIPTKDPYPDEETGTINTANPGNWIYSPTIKLKPSREVRIGGLEITKTLKDYAQREKEVGNARIIKDPATFIFEVTAYEKQGSETVVFHDYVSIVFDSYGKKSVLIENLPVDSYVEVREAYSGKVYSTDTDEHATILADKNVGVEFENEFEERIPGGGSVTNRFSYTEKDGWKSSARVADDTEESIQNPIKLLNEKDK